MCWIGQSNHRLNTVDGLNFRIRTGELSQVITESEAAYMVDIENAVKAILARRDELKVVIITALLHQEKTTTTDPGWRKTETSRDETGCAQCG
jgi:hypothetical protein